MSTHSTIAVVNEDGSVSMVYCHFDGYLGHIGKVLLNHYTTYNKVANLIGEGNISSINVDTLDSETPYVRYFQEASEEDIKTFSDLEEYYDYNAFEEYNYIFNTEIAEWFVSTYKEPEFVLLKILTLY
jgi:hypothetical protein